MYRFNRLFSTAFRNPKKVDRKVLPPELSTNVVKLKCKSSAKGGHCDVYVIGTIHGYHKSMQDVRAVVKFLKPQVVFLELCSSRREVLSKNSVEREMRVAFEEANTYGAKIVLGDRRSEITNGRHRDKFASSPFWQIMKMGILHINEFYNPSADDYYRKSSTFVDEWNRRICGPVFMEIGVDERDQYMSASLLTVARKHKSVVAVVGKGHLLGIHKYWQQPIEVKRLLSVPSKTKEFSYCMRLLVLYISFGMAVIVCLFFL